MMLSLMICSTVALYVKNPETTLIQTNLDVDNWIYGGISPNDYKKEVFEQIIQANNIVKCNSFFPFFNGENCVECPE